jgi:hypothetical protein
VPIPAIRCKARLEIFFLLSLQELPAVALPTQEKIDFKTSKLPLYLGQKI